MGRAARRSRHNESTTPGTRSRSGPLALTGLTCALVGSVSVRLVFDEIDGEEEIHLPPNDDADRFHSSMKNEIVGLSIDFTR